jgi:hypothetical protein
VRLRCRLVRRGLRCGRAGAVSTAGEPASPGGSDANFPVRTFGRLAKADAHRVC